MACCVHMARRTQDTPDCTQQSVDSKRDLVRKNKNGYFTLVIATFLQSG
jgi:hypothetical protein